MNRNLKIAAMRMGYEIHEPRTAVGNKDYSYYSFLIEEEERKLDL